MTGEDAAPTGSATGEQATAEGQRAGARRQRAVDLFSPHRYRALQVSVFERKFGLQRQPTASQDPAARAFEAAPGFSAPHGEDDAVDPLIGSGAPAAVAAAAPAHGIVAEHRFEALDPVPFTSELATPAQPWEAAPADAEAAYQAAHTDTMDLGYYQQPGADAAAGEYYGEAAPQQPQEWDYYETPTEQIATAWASEGQVWEGEDEQPAPKQGRNMRVATIAGIAMLVIVVLAARVHHIAFAVLLYAVACGAIVEWKRALEPHGRRIPLVPLIAATVGMGVATLAAKPEGLVVALMVGCAGVVAWRIGDERMENTLADSLAGVLTLLWIPFLASFLLLLELADNGWQRVLIIVLAVVGNDTGALITGMRFGRHKLLERVSPAKTWEGAAGGLVLGTAVAAGAAQLFFDRWYVGAAVGAAACVAAVVGDLAESTLKRDLRVKDMSSLLPGHGGILDRIDSLLFAAPVGYVVFAIFLGTLGRGGL